MPERTIGSGFGGNVRDAGQVAMALDEVSKCAGVEALVPDEAHSLSQKWQDLFGTCRFRARIGEEEQGHDVSSFINGQRPLRVGPALGEPPCRTLRASDRCLASLVDLDKGAVDKTPCAFGLTGEGSKDFGPETSIHPATPTAVEGVSPQCCLVFIHIRSYAYISHPFSIHIPPCCLHEAWAACEGMTALT